MPFLNQPDEDEGSAEVNEDERSADADDWSVDEDDASIDVLPIEIQSVS